MLEDGPYYCVSGGNIADKEMLPIAKRFNWSDMSKGLGATLYVVCKDID